MLVGSGWWAVEGITGALVILPRWCFLQSGINHLSPEELNMSIMLTSYTTNSWLKLKDKLGFFFSNLRNRLSNSITKSIVMLFEETFIDILEILGFKSHTQFSRFLVFVFHEFVPISTHEKYSIESFCNFTFLLWIKCM